MRILLIQVDGKMPNLALMKISAWHKNKGDIVGFNISTPDKVYISSIFSWNASKVRGISKLFDCIVEIGGTGIDISKKLPYEIEHIMPDYDLYDIDYSMGFTSRGCIRNCPFCIVPKKEGYIREHSPFEEFLHPDHKKVILLDNNFLVSPKWKEKLEFLRDSGLMVNFNQGLDIRLINEENAGLLADIKFFNWKWTFRQLHFAWDFIEIEKEVERGIQILKNAGIKPYQLMFYILCGYNTTFEEDMYRFKRLREWGVDPFVMIYNYQGKKKWKGDPRIPDFARWVNRRIYKSCSWEKYNEQQKDGIHICQI